MKTLTRNTVLHNRYVLQEEVGRGAVSSVWRASDTVLDRTVAVKILHPHLATNGSIRERFAAEAREAARLAHPSIVHVLDTGAEGATVFIVEEFVEGETLDDLLDRESRLEEKDAVRILDAVLAALDEAHRAGISHGDLKPPNIFVGDRVRVADFRMEPSSDGYRSPEHEGGVREDLYAAGAILYQALVGRAPTRADYARGVAPSPRSVRARIPRELDDVVVRALSRHPEDRFESAQGMRAALARTHIEAPAAEESPAHHQVRRSWILVPLLLVVIAAAVLVVGLATGRIQIGGPLGVRPAAPAPAEDKPSTKPKAPEIVRLDFSKAKAFDPLGDESETDADVALATDESKATFWKTEDYYGGQLRKNGVGLLLDLGEPQGITKFRLATPYPGFTFQVRVGNDPRDLVDERTDEYRAGQVTRQDVDPVSGRYVLVWITSVTDAGDGSHRAAIADFKVFGPDG